MPSESAKYLNRWVLQSLKPDKKFDNFQLSIQASIC